MALLKVLTAGEGTDRSKVISLFGEMISIGEILDVINNTAFIVSDAPPPSNRGVGSADFANRTDTINYLGVLGYAEHPTGLIALVLHEAAHLTFGGNNFFLRSYSTQRNDPTAGKDDFYGSDSSSLDYSKNLEFFINEVMTQAADALGLPLNGFRPTYGTPEFPADFWARHNIQPYPG